MPNPNEPAENLRVVYVDLHDGCRAILSLGTNNLTDADGRTKLWYQLEHEPMPTTVGPCRHGVIFPWQDGFGASPLHADDSDETLVALLNFLALKPGDTDKEYFDEYTEDQLDWVGDYSDDLWQAAEELSFYSHEDEEEEEESQKEGGGPHDAATATGMYDHDF